MRGMLIHAVLRVVVVPLDYGTQPSIVEQVPVYDVITIVVIYCHDQYEIALMFGSYKSFFKSIR